jgi:heme/copper-type cytochrome/quinol oxidase subunit 2
LVSHARILDWELGKQLTEFGSLVLKLDGTAWFWFVGAQAAFGSLASKASLADPAVPSIFSPSSTPADSIYHLSLFVFAVTGAIFVVVFSLLAYAAIEFRRRADDDGREPPQIYGSNQVELARTVIPVLIVVVLFLAAALASQRPNRTTASSLAATSPGGAP